MGTPTTIATPKTPVREVMSTVAIAARATDALATTAEQLVANDVGALPVLVGGQARGIITERDLVRAMAEGVDPDDARVSEYMTMEVESIDPATTVEAAVERMLDGGIRHLPVLDGEKLVGIVSVRDLLAVYATDR